MLSAADPRDNVGATPGVIQGRKATGPMRRAAGLPKGANVNSVGDLTHDPELGFFIWFDCALFGSKRTRGGHNA